MGFTVSVYTAFFDSWGFNTGYARSTNCRHFAHFMQISHFALAIFLTFYMGYLITYLSATVTVLEAINEISQYLCLISTCWICLIESLVKRKAQKSFWKCYRRLNENRISSGLAICLLEYFVCSMCILVTHLNLMNIPSAVLLPYFILFYIVQVRVFYHVFFMKLISIELRNVDHQIEVLRRSSDSRPFCQIRRVHHVVHELVEHVNGNAAFSNLVNILCQFCLMYSSINWMYLHSKDFTICYIFGEDCSRNG